MIKISPEFPFFDSLGTLAADVLSRVAGLFRRTGPSARIYAAPSPVPSLIQVREPSAFSTLHAAPWPVPSLIQATRQHPNRSHQLCFIPAPARLSREALKMTAPGGGLCPDTVVIGLIAPGYYLYGTATCRALNPQPRGRPIAGA